MSIYLGSTQISMRGGGSSISSDELSNLVDLIYPVGSIYLSVNNINPSSIFGGTWTLFGAGKTLVGVDLTDADFNVSEMTGGEKTHILTIDEMPSHNHPQNVTANSGGTGTRRDFQADGSGFMSYSQGITTNNTGGGEAHNNMPPYITCYMWKRTA